MWNVTTFHIWSAAAHNFHEGWGSYTLCRNVKYSCIYASTHEPRPQRNIILLSCFNHCIWSTGISGLLLRAGLVHTSQKYKVSMHLQVHMSPSLVIKMKWYPISTQDYQTYVHIGTRYPGYITGNPTRNKSAKKIMEFDTWCYIMITTAQSYAGKYKFVAICIVTSVQHK